MAKLNQRLIDRACRSAIKHNEISRLITDAFMERYGATHSEADEDWLIDTLDCGIGPAVSLERCDKLMLEAGYPVLSKKRNR